MIGIVPAQFTGKDREAAEAAIKAYQGMRQVFDQASADPGKMDWEPQIRRFAAGPAAEKLIYSITGYREQQLRQVGIRWSTATVTKVTGPDVYLTECVDLTHMQVLDKDGKTWFQSTRPRLTQALAVEDFGPNGWLVYLITASDPAEPC